MRLRPLALGLLAMLTVVLSTARPGVAQSSPADRLVFNDQELFLSGGNVAWVNFARDIGPGRTRLSTFETIFEELNAHGGNAMRLWLHTTGATTPAWDGATVVGPGAGAIDDLRAILDAAWEHEIGLVLCLWSFDMLRISNGPTVTDRAFALLTDPTLTQTYVDNALTPMVEAVAGHPALVAWEIFNEPEGMSHEFGWAFNRHVAMEDIQRFVNMTAGAIHRADANALVTNGAWSFRSLTDTPVTLAAKRGSALTTAEVSQLQRGLSAKYAHPFSPEEARSFYETLSRSAAINYYTDERLVAAGGDELGVLDFYSVHYYEWGGTELSPFHHDYATWGLDKPLVVAEFFMGSGSDPDPDAVYGVPQEDLYPTLLERGYAGALAWQWYNYPNSAEGVINWPRILASTQRLYDQHRGAVDVQPGLRIASFQAEPTGIELGASATLSWRVSAASTVTLDGLPVDSVGTQTVRPDQTTTYTLEAVGLADTTSAQVTVSVLDPNQVNRAWRQPAVASSVETCCGVDATAHLAFDGDLSTRWSSAWHPDEADATPDDEWIYVDLGALLDIERVVLQWEAAYGLAYDLEVSFDGRLWTPVHEERAGDGGTDEIRFDEPATARYLRLHGLRRGTEWGFSLWEFEVYGTASARRPPAIALVAPVEGAIVQPGSDVTLRPAATDDDGRIAQVDLYIGSVRVSTQRTPPYTFTWRSVPPGDFALKAVAIDDDGLAVSTPPIQVFARPPVPFMRYEAEAATLAGDVSVEREAAGSSGTGYLFLRDSGTLTFTDVTVDTAGLYLLMLRYYLPFGYKAQYLNVNGERVAELGFDGPTNQWLTRGAQVALRAGPNTIQLEKYWGWMYVDYLGLGLEAVNVSTGPEPLLPTTTSLGESFPNPFASSATIPFTVATPGHVRVDVFDLTGRRVATLVDEVRTPGRHEVRFDARHLASGVYVSRLQTDTVQLTRPLLLVR
ncbi:MAG: discoidin domain-containing protein [Bacteroidota bacterium]